MDWFTLKYVQRKGQPQVVISLQLEGKSNYFSVGLMPSSSKLNVMKYTATPAATEIIKGDNKFKCNGSDSFGGA